MLFTEEADEVMHAYLVYVYSMFGQSHIPLSDNGTEFKNKLFMQVVFTLGMKQVFSALIILKAMGILKMYIIS